MRQHLDAAEPWWEPGTAQGYHMCSFGFLLGEIVRRVSGRTLGEYLRKEIAEPLGIDVHIGLPPSEHHRCADMVNKPHIRDVLHNGRRARLPATIDEHPMAAFSVAIGFIPDDELGTTDITAWRTAEFPPPTPTSPRSAWRPSTTRWLTARSSATSTWS